MFDIKEELKNIPTKPGVYLMFDKEDVIIYIGKAKVLKNRVSQYFQNGNKHSLRIKNLVKKIKRFEYIVTKTEVEALILENNLIKKHDPKYNVRLKDDKTYPYIKLTLNEMFPRLFITRNVLNDKAKYFGPFTNSAVVKENIELLNKIFPLRKCKKKFPRDLGKERPCLNYHINNCNAPCNFHISKDQYDKMVQNVLDFLNGNDKNILKNLEEDMLKASDNLEFEKAIEIRDKIFAIKKLKENQLVENTAGEDKDVIAFAKTNFEALFQIFFIRAGKITGREHFLLNNIEGFSRAEILAIFVKQFYSGTPFIPKEILLQEDIEDFDTIQKWLSALKNQKVFVTIPKKGEKLKLVEMAYENACITLDKFGEQIKREQQKTILAIEEISKALNIDIYLKRIEAFDISNIQGVHAVGSMVVFEDGKPKKSDYRKFKIKTVFKQDDYASMQEVIERRFNRYITEINENIEDGKFNKIPDIIFLDGGKGQISAVSKVLQKLNLNILICGMVKDDYHRTRGLLFNGKEVLLKKSSEGFKLITRIQDEVHRFAIEFHRKTREKDMTKSILDEIPGVGDTRKKALLKHFGSIDKIRKATIEELKQVDIINEKVARDIYNFFNAIR